MSAILRARNLGRWYGEVIGLNDLTVDVPPGVTGLIGPNGAGKSTFMKLIVGELRPSRGAIEVFGLRPFANRQLYGRIGFCPQQDALYDHMTGRAFVRYCLRLMGKSPREADRLALRALDRVGLTEHMNRRTRDYSKGMRQRVRLAQALAHDPELLIADEPLSGLDPVARHETLELLRELGRSGTSVILSSHVLHEVQSLTQKIVLIHRGRLLAQGSVEEVRKLLSRHPRRVTIEAREARGLGTALLAQACVHRVELGPEDGRLEVETRDIAGLYSYLTTAAAGLGCGIKHMQSSDSNLEAVFDYLVD